MKINILLLNSNFPYICSSTKKCEFQYTIYNVHSCYQGCKFHEFFKVFIHRFMFEIKVVLSLKIWRRKSNYFSRYGGWSRIKKEKDILTLVSCIINQTSLSIKFPVFYFIPFSPPKSFSTSFYFLPFNHFLRCFGQENLFPFNWSI